APTPSGWQPTADPAAATAVAPASRTPGPRQPEGWPILRLGSASPVFPLPPWLTSGLVIAGRPPAAGRGRWPPARPPPRRKVWVEWTARLPRRGTAHAPGEGSPPEEC